MPIEYIAVGPFAWGKGETIKQAKARMRRNIPGWVAPGYSYRVYETNGGCEVSEIDGGILFAKGHRPTIVEERIRKVASK